MKRLILASALFTGLAGAALAQEAPVYQGNYGPAVSERLNDNATGEKLDFTATASIPSQSKNAEAPAQLRSFNPNYNGR